MMLNEKQEKSLDAFRSFVGNEIFTRKDISRFTDETKTHKELGVIRPWFLVDVCEKIDRGEYRFPTVNGSSTETVDESNVVSLATNVAMKSEEVSMATNVIEFPNTDKESYVPSRVKEYVKFGHYGDVKTIKKSGQFYPVFITGLSGNGKTLNIIQSCAELKRELVRVNITVETDEDDLLGGFRLVGGATVWHDGPVIDAMKRGAILLLDEIDLASNKIMCLQPILEGNGVFLKKIGKFVEPTNGFNIVATANTKGKGSDDGRFIGANILNEAFLERFPVTFEQEYPSMKIENKILNNVMDMFSLKDDKFTENLVKWADVIRKTFYDGGVDEIIATRRLVHIINAYAIFKNKLKAVQVCVNRFDDDTKNSFLDLYTKVDAGVNIEDLNPGDTNDDEVIMEDEVDPINQ